MTVGTAGLESVGYHNQILIGLIFGGVLDGSDPEPFDPLRCGDSDLDGCDDCTSGTLDPGNDCQADDDSWGSHAVSSLPLLTMTPLPQMSIGERGRALTDRAPGG